MFCELKILKLGPSCVYNLCSGLRRIRSQYFADKSNLTNMNLNGLCKEKDLEICAVKSHLPSHEICVITIYRSPSGNYQYFIDKVETILNMIYSNSVEIIMCGDININYLINSTSKQLLDSLLASYGLHSTVQFPTRIQNNSYTTIDNIFLIHLNLVTLQCTRS